MQKGVPAVIQQKLIDALRTCKQEKDLGHAQSLHAYMRHHQLESHPVLGNYLVPMLVECGSLRDAECAFDALVSPNEHSWSSLMSGYINGGRLHQALHLYDRMQQDEFTQPDRRIYLALLNSCAKLKDTKRGLGLHLDIVKRGLDIDIFDGSPMLGNSLVDLYCKCNLLCEAQQVFERLPFRNAVSWSALVAGYAEQGFAKEAGECLKRMQIEGVSADAVTFVCSLKACSGTDSLEIGHGIHTETVLRGLEANVQAGSALVGMYVKCGSITEAQEVFDQLPRRNAISWTALITGYSEHGLGERLGNCLDQMRFEGVAADIVMFVCSLKACGSVRALDLGCILHAEVTKRNWERDLHISSTLVDMYAEFGLLAEAWQVFSKLPVRDTVSWNSLIAGYTEHSLDKEVLNFFHKMQLEGISIDDTTAVFILKACGSVGALEIGQEIHAETMKRGSDKDISMASTLIDMYTKCNLLEDAHQLLDQLPMHDSVSWATVIFGYAERGFPEAAEKLFRDIWLKAVPADSLSLVSSLKVCGRIGSLEKGHEAHMEALKRGLESELHMSNSLIDMYSKCGSFAEARQLFDRLQDPGLLSWTALISGYTEHRLDQEVLECYAQMLLEGVPADGAISVCSLKACSNTRTLKIGQEIHTDLAKRGLESELFVGSALVVMYAKCNLLAEARHLFDELAIHDAVTWAALLSGYAENGIDEEVLNCFTKMQLEGICVDAVTFVCSLKSCCTLRAFDMGQQIHAETIKRGLEMDFYVSSILVDMYIKCCSLAEAHQVFECLPVRSVVLWNVLITGYAGLGLDGIVQNCLQQMQFEGLSPDSVTFISSLKACATAGARDRVLEIHTELIKNGLERDLYIGRTLLAVYAKCGLLAEARQVFNQLPARDTVSWAAIMAGCADQILCLKPGNYIQEMHMEGISPDSVTFICSLKVCGTTGAVGTGQELHAETAKLGLEKELHLGSTLVDMYCKCGYFAEAKHVFNRLPLRDVVLWNTLISGFADHGLDEEVLKSFRQMQLEGVLADPVTFLSCLKACSNVGALETGRDIHAEIRKAGFEGNLTIGNMLVDMYGKCSSIVEAQEVFRKLLVRDVISWTAMIKAYGENHEGLMAVQCFEEMQEHGIKPNSVTFTCLLAACSHASLLLKGQEYFKVMKEVHNIKPTSDHYACMVDLFARSGHIFEAERFLVAMQKPPSSVLLLSLLNGCKIYGKVEAGERCFQQLVELSEDDASAYLLMADVYSSAGRVIDVKKVEDLRKFVGAGKKPGSASLEVNMKLYEFVVGVNPSVGMSGMLEILNFRLKEKGHVPSLDMGVRLTSSEKSNGFASTLVGKYFSCITAHECTIMSNKTLKQCDDFAAQRYLTGS